MKPTDETALRRRLHDEVDRPAVRPVPEEAVFRRFRAIRTRRLAAAAAGAAVLAVGGLVIGALGRSGGAPPRPAGHLRPAGGPSVFATGTVNGRRWRLAAVNLADPGYRCLPGVVINGQNGDLMPDSFLPGLGLGDVAFFAAEAGRPGIGFAFLRLRPGVRDVTADLGDHTRRHLKPVPVTVCGQRFRLAGFVYPRQGVTEIAGRSPAGRPIEYQPLPDYFNPSSPFESGSWVNVPGATGLVAAGQIGSGTIGGTGWRVRVTLGPDGECFASETAPFEPASGASFCQPVNPAPGGVSLSPLPYALLGRTLVWYLGTVNAQAAYLRVWLSNGQASRLMPVVVAGRKYIVVGLEKKVKLARLILYNGQGRVLSTVIPRGFLVGNNPPG